MKLEINKMLTLSTAHISDECIKALDDNDHDLDGIVVYDKSDYGWFIYILDYFQTSSYKCLDKCINFAKENGCDLLCLDRDGSIIKTDKLDLFDF